MRRSERKDARGPRKIPTRLSREYLGLTAPAAAIITTAVIAGSVPSCTNIRRASPVAGAPGVPGAGRIPVTIDKGKSGARGNRRRISDYRRRGRRYISVPVSRDSDTDADSNAGEHGTASCQEQKGQQLCFHRSTSYTVERGRRGSGLPISSEINDRGIPAPLDRGWGSMFSVPGRQNRAPRRSRPSALAQIPVHPYSDRNTFTGSM
jgi:hypothetical protein